MKTRRFDVSFDDATFDNPGTVRLRAKVQTDHAHHYVTQLFDVNGFVKSTWIDNSRAYTPEQREAANRLFLHYYPIVKRQAMDWLVAHNFDYQVDEVTVNLDLETGVTRMNYEK